MRPALGFRELPTMLDRKESLVWYTCDNQVSNLVLKLSDEQQLLKEKLNIIIVRCTHHFNGTMPLGVRSNR